MPDAAIGSTVGGRVTAVLVSEGAAVRSGQVLVRLDDTQQRADAASAVARLAGARAALADVRAGAKPDDLARARELAAQMRAQDDLARSTRPYQTNVSEQQVQQAESRARAAMAAEINARRNADRMRHLAATGDVSAQQRDAAVTLSVSADAELAQAKSAIRSVRAQLGDTTRVRLPQTADAAHAAYLAALSQYRSLAAPPRPAIVRQAEAAIAAAQGDVSAARRRVAEGVVRAPVNGTVRAIDLHPGDLVAPGTTVASIDENGRAFTRIYVPQSDLGAVRIGAHVPVRSDSQPGATFAGTVAAVDAQAQFTPQNVQTASDRAVLSFGVKVYVDDPQHRLYGGTTVEVRVP